MHALVAEIKARRDASARPKKPIGGVLVGEKGREILRKREEDAGKREGETGRPWYRRWG